MTTQKCQNPNAPRERPTHERSNAETKTPLPPVTGGHFIRAEMP